MANPIVVEVMRGRARRIAPPRRRCGRRRRRRGRRWRSATIDEPVFPRSAVKALQSLPLIESGAADALRLSEAEIALACASHSGASAHVETAAAMLAKAGLDAASLACGAHWPLGEDASRALARAGQTPSPLHNNCSGKHAGFLCLACVSGWATGGYESAAHPVQRAVKAAVEDVTGAALGEDVCATDGCSIPTYAVPLRALALGFARLATGAGLAPRPRRRRQAHFRRRRGESGDGRGRGAVRQRSHAPVRPAHLRQDRARRGSIAPPCRNSASASRSRPTTARPRGAGP